MTNSTFPNLRKVGVAGITGVAGDHHVGFLHCLPEGVELGEGGVHGTIGPVEALEVRWFAADRPQSGGLRGPVEATMLWDARPVGDLLRVRLTHADPDGASTIRLALEPGLLVRGFSIPDLVGIRQEGTAERPEWVAQIDPRSVDCLPPPASVGAVDCQARLANPAAEHQGIGQITPVGQDFQQAGAQPSGQGELGVEIDGGETVRDHGSQRASNRGCYRHCGEILASL